MHAVHAGPGGFPIRNVWALSDSETTEGSQPSLKLVPGSWELQRQPCKLCVCGATASLPIGAAQRCATVACLSDSLVRVSFFARASAPTTLHARQALAAAGVASAVDPTVIGRCDTLRQVSLLPPEAPCR